MRPMLFVGNHQTYALDIGFLVEQLVKERGIMPRGLAHPAIFAVRCGPVGCCISAMCAPAAAQAAHADPALSASAGSDRRQEGRGHTGLWQLHDDVWRRAGAWLLIASVSASSLVCFSAS